MYQVSAMPRNSSQSRKNNLNKVVRVHFHLLKRSFLRNCMWWILASISVIIFISLYGASFSLINNAIGSLWAQIWDKHALSSFIYAITLLLCISLIRDYLSGDFKWTKHQRAAFILIPVIGFAISYTVFECTGALLGIIILTSAYLLYAYFIEKAGKTAIPPKSHDQLYRSRLFNRTHQHIRKLAKSTPHGLTIGICGQWGCGKTFFIDTLLALLSRPVDLNLRNSDQWNEKFIICKKVELWSASSLDDAWNRIIHALHIGIFNRPPISKAKAKKFLSFLTALSTNQTAAHELIELILPELEDVHLQSIVNKMKERKIVLVIDDLERADFAIIQAMLPLFERLKKLPNLIVICAVAEDELKQVFLRERVLPDFVQGHLAKLFDLRIEIPTMAYTAIENFQNNLFSSKYKDCPLVKSFLTKYPLRFDSARQMIRVIDRLTSIERQYYANCPYHFKNGPNREDDSILAKVKYIFLIESLRETFPNLLKQLINLSNYLSFLESIPFAFIAHSAYEIMQDGSERESYHVNKDEENNWINNNKNLYIALTKQSIEWSIISHLTVDIKKQDAIEKKCCEENFKAAYYANYTRCSSLLEWEMDTISDDNQYENKSYTEKIRLFYSTINESPEPKFLAESAYTLFRFELNKTLRNQSKISSINNSLTLELGLRESSYIAKRLYFQSFSFMNILRSIGYTARNKNFDFELYRNLLITVYKILPIDEQADVLIPFFYRLENGVVKNATSDYVKYGNWLYQETSFNVFAKDLCYVYGYNLAGHIFNYPEGMYKDWKADSFQAYAYEKKGEYLPHIQYGIKDYITQHYKQDNFISSWIDYIGHYYRDPSIAGEKYSTYASMEVYQMMTYIKATIFNQSKTEMTGMHNPSLVQSCHKTLQLLHNDLKEWNKIKRNDKIKHVKGLQRLIQMIEEIQKAAI